jgi:tetratricopeptide (TPR) repeat protein
MAGKLKKTSRFSQPKGFGTPNLAKTAPLSQLRRANSLVVEKQFSAAKTLLQSLNQTYPHDREVLVMMVNVCLDMDDMIGYGKACAQLGQVDPNNAEAAYGLAGAYIANGHPLLAIQALRTAVEKFPNYEKAAQTHQTIAELQPRADEMLAGMNLEGEDGLKSALLHEQGQVYMTQGDLDLAEQAEKAALQLRPELISAQNNLSLISWQQGNFDQAIAIAHQVLDQESDNIHALSNLIHFYYLKGEFELAVPLSERLKTSQGKAWDGWTKKAEGLSFLRDDAGVLEIFAAAQAAGEVDDASTSPLFLHLVAVALARLGRVKEAIQQ